MSARQVLLVGGPADRQVVTVLYGSSVIMGNPGTEEREVYAIVRIAGGTEMFEVGVPQKHATGEDGWLIRTLLEGYAGRPIP